MKYFIVLSLVLPFCLAIEVEIFTISGTGIKKVEIPSCAAQPCPFIKGTPLNISITVESVYPADSEFPTVTDFETSISIQGYRTKYIYGLLRDSTLNKYCKSQPDECPLSMNKLYKINSELFLSEDDPNANFWPYGSKNGKTEVNINVVMNANDTVGTVIGDTYIFLDIKAPTPLPLHSSKY